MKRVLVIVLALLLVTTALGSRAEVATTVSANCAVAVSADAATCLAQRATRVATGTPAGLTPAQLRDAYKLPLTLGKVTTVAVVTAYDDARAESDLATYRARFGLAPCTTANRCFRKVGQTGTKALPKVDAAWAGETSLDIEMVSAACAHCRILLVEARSSSMADLATAVDYAATQHVAAISNSYAGNDASHAASYNHPGIAIVAAAGDSGYGAGAPASYRTVIAAGGTTLTRAANKRGWGESAWSSTGSSCAASTTRPSWQGSATKCSGKAVTDVSAVADPRSGVAAYIGTPYGGMVGWQVMGGTSVATPLIAGIYALSGRTAGYPAAWTWAHRSSLNDVTVGANGRCTTSVWCHARAGWDGPTGLGTPSGLGAF